ncbi:MAG TPA: alkaline phosphatase family protein [Solirubrobacteraceae bacterium]
MSLDPLRRFEQRIGALPMPSPLVWAALIAAFLGFGVLLGRATGNNAFDTLAAQRRPLKLLVAGAPTPATPGTASTSAPTTPPPAETETTPELAPAASGESSKATQPPPASKTNTTAGGSEKPFGGNREKSPKSPKATLTAIKHVWVVMLSDQPYATAFGPSSPAHYLTGTLEKQGKLLLRYYAVAHEELANEIALLSGQGPTEATAANCPTYTEIAPAAAGSDGQVLGKGCVYPASTPTLMEQLTTKHLTWKAYVEGIDEGTGGAPACAHPASGAADPSAVQPNGQTALPSYQTWRNPFVYFQGIVVSPACATHDVGMGELGVDLGNEARTPNFSYIAPGPCDDASPTACAPGKASGMMAADAFLHKNVSRILSSKAYKKGGLLAITVDEAPSSGEFEDSSSCCGQPQFPNLPAPTGAAALGGPQGGGQVGLLLLSPFVKGGGLVQESYNHFSLLATIERVFGLAKLGYAGLPEVKAFSSALFSG